ncbi:MULTISPECIES: hypothetical protein [unclassified Lysinibacillus]|uniref:hypothetical protein n=1 Tax=unclassified Lysinibacillus TaxID=2636778 RepID=UPI00372D2B39
MHLELINNTLTTMLLDCISHYPKRGQQKECFGLIFGEQDRNAVGEYTFPVANVLNKTASSVKANEQVNDIVKEARKLVTTSDFVAYYHSHPYDEIFDEWADPSVGDLRVAKDINSNIEVIFAIVKSKDVDTNATLKYEYLTDMQYRFFEEKSAKNNEPPEAELIGKDGHIIQGHYRDYDFIVRAYKWTGSVFEEIKLYSSEVEMSLLLYEQGLIIEELPKEAMYHLKKLEYSLRLANKDKYKEKIPYLIEKIKSVGVK